VLGGPRKPNASSSAESAGPVEGHAHVVAHLAEGFCQGIGGILVVVDDEDAPARCTVVGQAWRGGGGGGVHRPVVIRLDSSRRGL